VLGHRAFCFKPLGREQEETANGGWNKLSFARPAKLAVESRFAEPRKNLRRDFHQWSRILFRYLLFNSTEDQHPLNKLHS